MKKFLVKITLETSIDMNFLRTYFILRGRPKSWNDITLDQYIRATTKHIDDPIEKTRWDLSVYLNKDLSKVNSTGLLKISRKLAFRETPVPSEIPESVSHPLELWIRPQSLRDLPQLQYEALRRNILSDNELLNRLGVSNTGSTDTAGMIRWNGSKFQGYDGSAWVNLYTSANVQPVGDGVLEDIPKLLAHILVPMNTEFSEKYLVYAPYNLKKIPVTKALGLRNWFLSEAARRY